jgi:hypothetical protein
MTGISDLPHDVEAPTSAVADGSMPSTEKRGDTMRMLAAFLATDYCSGLSKSSFHSAD